MNFAERWRLHFGLSIYYTTIHQWVKTSPQVNASVRWKVQYQFFAAFLWWKSTPFSLAIHWIIVYTYWLDFKSLYRGVLQFIGQVEQNSFHSFTIFCRFFFRADSVTWNPHKLMGTLLQCSTLHVKENVSFFLLLLSISIRKTNHTFKILMNLFFFFLKKGLLISCNQMSADYLFQTDKVYDVCYDTGDKVIQCGRHNDIFKLWLQWRSRVSFQFIV